MRKKRFLFLHHNFLEKFCWFFENYFLSINFTYYKANVFDFLPISMFFFWGGDVNSYNIFTVPLCTYASLFLSLSRVPNLRFGNYIGYPIFKYTCIYLYNVYAYISLYVCVSELVCVCVGYRDLSGWHAIVNIILHTSRAPIILDRTSHK